MGSVQIRVASPPHRRPDASMSLLSDIAGDALDPGYAIASAKAGARASADGRSPHRPSVVLAVGVLLATVLVMVAAVQAHIRAPSAARTRNDLVASVRAQSAAVAGLSRQIDSLRDSTAQLRDRMLAGTAAGAQLSAQVRQQEVAAGQAAVSGPGLRVTLDDTTETSTGNRLQDRDLQAVVNALWAAGAEAVAVGGQRLTAQSAIREAGEAILVDFQPLTAPYVIDAIGDPKQLQTSYDGSSAAARIRAYQGDVGLKVTVNREDALHLPAAADETLHFARPIPSAAPSGGGGG